MEQPRKKIIVADDDASFRMLLYYYLREVYEVIQLPQAEDVIAFLSKPHEVVAVALDVSFNGGMSGPEAVKAIRPFAADLPILALTGFVFESDRKELLEIGFSDVLGKPFSQEQLLKTLEKWVSS